MNINQPRQARTGYHSASGLHGARERRRLRIPRWLWAIWAGIILLSTVIYVVRLRSQSSSSDETTTLVNKLSEVIQLPNERPVLATVSNKDELSGKPFSGQVKNGDKILLYLQAKRSLLYRPSTGKIIDIAPIQSNPTFKVPPKQ